jgi:hypothetical protein
MSGIPCRCFRAQVLFEHCLKRNLPTLAERRNSQHALQLLAGLSWQIQECINVGHADSLWPVSKFYDVVACANFAFLQHAKVESWSVMGDEKDFGGSRPADKRKVQPYDPYHFHHHSIHRKEAHYRGERVPEEDSFYEEIAKDITRASEIVLIGHATGKVATPPSS